MNWTIGLSLLNNFIGNLIVEMPEEGIDGSLYSLYFFSLLIRYIKAKIFLHGNNQFNRVQRVKTELLKGSSFSEFLLIALCSASQDLEHFALDLLH